MAWRQPGDKPFSEPMMFRFRRIFESLSLDDLISPLWMLLQYVSVVCFITKSFLTYSFFHLHLLYQPYLGLCQAQCVQSHQRQPMSAVAITACEVQVSAADSQTVPTVATGV